MDEVKNPTVSIEAGSSSPEGISFTVTSTDATTVAWVVVESSEAVPTASEILVNGTSITPNEAVACKAEALKAGTEYRVVAAAQNSAAVVKADALIATQPAGGDVEPSLNLTSASEMSFAAEGGNGEIKYELKNPVEGVELTATSEAAWITDITVGQTVTFVVTTNEAEAREAIVVVAYGDLNFEVKVKQVAKGETPAPDTTVFTAPRIAIEYYGTEDSSAHNYWVVLSDNDMDNGRPTRDNSIYYCFDLYSSQGATTAKGTLPNGTYALSSSMTANTLGPDYSYHVDTTGADMVVLGYEEALVTITDNKIIADLILGDGTKHQVVYEGSLSWGEGGGDTPEVPEFEATHTATRWMWSGSSSWGNRYNVYGDGISFDIHFTEAVAQQTSLAAGTYTWVSTSFFGADDNFSVRNLLVGGYSKYAASGTAVVTVNGEDHHIELIITDTNGATYMIQFDGKLNDDGNSAGEETEDVVFTKMEYNTYNQTYYYYDFQLTNGNGDSMNLYINDMQAKDWYIETGSYQWITASYSGNKGYFSTKNVMIGGTSYTVESGSMDVVTDPATYKMDITITLKYGSGVSQVFKYSGKVGEEDNGGTTPSDPTKLATPSVAGIVSGNAATVSWQPITGAKDYTVTLNGTDVKTVTETYIVYTDLAYETTYSVSVVANPADSAVNTASDAGTATFTTEAEGGSEGGNGGNVNENFEDWTFEASLDFASLILTLTDGSRTITFQLSELAGATFIINGAGTLNATNVTVDGVAAAEASGSVELSSALSYHVVINAMINGVKYTGTSSNKII